MPENTWYRRGPALDRLPIGHEPQAGQPIGIPEGEALGIHISDEAADFIGKFISADTERAMGGILVGYAARSNRPFILIRSAIEARDAEVVNGDITFTDRSWDYMRQVWEREYPGTLVLGWFCSHPGAGVAVGGYDRFLHHRTFNRPWQVIFEIDPVKSASMFYRWNDDRLLPVENFYVWNARKEPPASLLPINAYRSYSQEPVTVRYRRAEVSPPVGGTPQDAAADKHLASPAQRETAATQETLRRPAYAALLPWAIIVLALFLFFWPGWPWSVPHLWSLAGERRQEMQQMQQMLDNPTTAAPATTPTAGSGLDAAPSDSSSVGPISTNAPPGGDTPPSAAGQPKPRASPAVHEQPVTYEIKPGDTLWEISEKVTGNPFDYHRLAQSNGIADPSLIYPGKKLHVSGGTPN